MLFIFSFVPLSGAAQSDQCRQICLDRVQEQPSTIVVKKKSYSRCIQKFAKRLEGISVQRDRYRRCLLGIREAFKGWAQPGWRSDVEYKRKIQLQEQACANTFALYQLKKVDEFSSEDGCLKNVTGRLQNASFKECQRSEPKYIECLQRHREKF